MIFALDTEFIDSPTCSALISLALVDWTDRSLYLEFVFPYEELLPWHHQNVVPHLTGSKVSFPSAAQMIREFVEGSKYNSPDFWAYYGAYDWYWFCRVFGGFINMPKFYPHRFCEFAIVQQGIPDVCGPAHNALNDAKSLMIAMKAAERDGKLRGRA